MKLMFCLRNIREYGFKGNRAHYSIKIKIKDKEKLRLVSNLCIQKLCHGLAY